MTRSKAQATSNIDIRSMASFNACVQVFVLSLNFKWVNANNAFLYERITLCAFFRYFFNRLNPFMVLAGEDRKYGIWLLQFLNQYVY